MNSYETENEMDFQDLYVSYIKNNGLAGLKFDKIFTEYWLDKEKKNRIDIKAQIGTRNYYYELKDYRKLSSSQVYYMLGELFLQMDRYSKLLDKNKDIIKAIIMLPKNMPASAIEDISIMFRARKIFIEIYTTENLYILDYDSINLLKEEETK